MVFIILYLFVLLPAGIVIIIKCLKYNKNLEKPLNETKYVYKSYKNACDKLDQISKTTSGDDS